MRLSRGGLGVVPHGRKIIPCEREVIPHGGGLLGCCLVALLVVMLKASY